MSAGWNFADVWEAVAQTVPERIAQLHGGRKISWNKFDWRANGIAWTLLQAGCGRQDKVALYLRNGPEYLQSAFACMKAALVPVNTNYRYQRDELHYLWDNADATAVIFHGAFTETVEAVRARCAKVRLWMHVEDGSVPCPPWAVSYEEAAWSWQTRVEAAWGRSGDDQVLIYTGGTTGRPRGVMWRRADSLRRSRIHRIGQTPAGGMGPQGRRRGHTTRMGADAGYRILRAKRRGERAVEKQQDDAPQVSLEPKEALLHPAELRAGLRMPVALYAILESAWHAKNGLAVDEHRKRLGAMYQRFSEVAAGNPGAWRTKPVSALEISEPSASNPMQAFPYTRLHCANWNVDQAAALLVCSAAKAQALGIAPASWVYALASTESNHMVPVSARADLAGCIGARLAGSAALAACDLDASQLDLVELYSCFPIAVESYAQALSLSPARELTVTGGMAFAGGPFNNYVLQVTCRMAALIREGRGRNGLVSSVSGILTKQGFGVWASQPGAGGFAFSDVSADTARLAATKDVADGFHGLAQVAGYTVLCEKGNAPRALVLADTDAHCRALAWSADPVVIQQMESREFCGASIAMQGALFTAA